MHSLAVLSVNISIFCSDRGRGPEFESLQGVEIFSTFFWNGEQSVTRIDGYRITKHIYEIIFFLLFQ